MVIPEGWSKADLHIHTSFSDGAATPAEVVAHTLRHTDLRVIAITDHNTIAGALEAQACAARTGLQVIVGEEISTAGGHMLALFLERAIPRGLSPAATVAAVRAQGGLCLPAHPFSTVMPSLGRRALLLPRRDAALAAPGYDGLETFNASIWLDRNNARAAACARRLGLAACGGSDAHHLHTIGAGFTLFPGSSAADVRTAILRGLTLAGGGGWGVTRNLHFVQRWLRGSLTRMLRPA